MTKFTLALMAAAALVVTSAYAGDKEKDGGCCATHASNKMDCTQTYAKLNLSAEQKTKMDALVAKCNKDGGCTKESMEAFMKSAEGVLSKDQLATLKAECNKMHEKKDAKA
jgi:Spy/CpxP family protein refolding chaperone